MFIEIVLSKSVVYHAPSFIGDFFTFHASVFYQRNRGSVSDFSASSDNPEHLGVEVYQRLARQGMPIEETPLILFCDKTPRVVKDNQGLSTLVDLQPSHQEVGSFLRGAEWGREHLEITPAYVASGTGLSP